ncbi:MAG: hypothetical protein ACXU8O_01500 [Asticcacaulis sp.]
MPSTSSSQALNWASFARPAISVAALAAGAACVMAVWQLTAPLSAPTVFPFSETDYVKTVDAAAANRPADAIRWAQKATHDSPNRAENWVLLAYAYETADRSISPRVSAALRKSYEVAPLSNDAHDFRLAQVFGNWTRFPDDLHKLAIKEARVYASYNKGQNNLRVITPNLPDPAGRMALGIIVMRAQTERMIAARQKELNEAAAHGASAQ